MWGWDDSTGNARKGAWNDEIAEGSRLWSYYLLIEYEPTEQTTLDLHPSVLSDAKVVPDCGQENSDEFEFSVVYKDEDGDDLVEANVAIRGWVFDSTEYVFDKGDYNDMEYISGDSKQGAVYSFKRQLPGKGEYHYAFYFTNSKGITVRLPEQGFGDNYGLPGPIVGKECMRATITVPATDDWIDTDFQVSEGDSIKFEASGQATYGHESYEYEGYPATDPDGNRFLDNVNIDGKIDPNAVNPSAPIGSLIGKVGPNGDCFYIGSKSQRIMPATGTIMLRYNDVEGGYGNNGGSYEVTISGMPTMGEKHTGEQEVIFPDPNLEAAIREAIHKPKGGIRIAELADLNRLAANQSGIKDITGLEHCKNLQVLDIACNQIIDISPLSSLTSLQTLGLGKVVSR